MEKQGKEVRAQLKAEKTETMVARVLHEKGYATLHACTHSPQRIVE